MALTTMPAALDKSADTEVRVNGAVCENGTIPVWAVQRYGVVTPSIVLEDPMTTEPSRETPVAVEEFPPSVPRLCVPPDGVQRNATRSEDPGKVLEPTTVSPSSLISPAELLVPPSDGITKLGPPGIQ